MMRRTQGNHVPNAVSSTVGERLYVVRLHVAPTIRQRESELVAEFAVTLRAIEYELADKRIALDRSPECGDSFRRVGASQVMLVGVQRLW